jgi:hypothetical protein
MYLGSLLSVRGQRILDKLGPHTHTHRQTFSGSNPPPKTPPGKKKKEQKSRIKIVMYTVVTIVFRILCY